MEVPRAIERGRIVAGMRLPRSRQFARRRLMIIMSRRADQTSINPLRMAISVSSAEFPAPSFCLML
jgi:hypothetical protein